MSAAATPRIQYPLKSVRRVVRRMPRWLTMACEAVIATTATICASTLALGLAVAGSNPKRGPIAAEANCQVPTLTAARTVIRPARLNHAVTQPQPRPPRIDAQW